MNKVYPNAQAAMFDIKNGATIMLGGFGLNGIPENAINELVLRNLKDLTCISNNAGTDGFGLGKLIERKQVKKMIASYVGENAEFERQLLCDELDVELIPQGTLATGIQMAAMGIPAYFTPAGVGTEIALGKVQRRFGGKSYLMEMAIHGDFALVKAWKGDHLGNLIFRKATRNFSTSMARAASVTIAEVEELVAIGDLDPDRIDVPGIYVKRIFQGINYQKRIEKKIVKL